MYDLSSHTILAIDDEDDNLLVLESTLAMLHGAIVKVARDAEEALEILNDFHPTTIVADLSMPKMDGFELLKVLRQRADTRALPIIAVTAHAMLGDRERVLAAGFDGYISKPFEVAAIGDQIGSLIDAHRARQAQQVTACAEGNAVSNTVSMVAQSEFRTESVEWSKIPDEIQ